MTVKSRGVYFRYFRWLPLKGTFHLFLAQSSLKKSATNNGRMKTMCEFSQKGVFFSHSRCLPIEGTFYHGTIFAFSIRYISEKYLQDVKIATSRQDGTKREIEWYGSNWPIPQRKSSIHSAYAQRPRPRRKSSRKEAQHICGTVKGKNEGDRLPYSIGLCPIL